jgi:hypothetical protein
MEENVGNENSFWGMADGEFRGFIFIIFKLLFVFNREQAG